ncbi:MAG: TraB/GumN family protein [Micropepsaceae bacterium]
MTPRIAAALLLAASTAACAGVPQSPPRGIIADDAPEIAERPAPYDLSDVSAASGAGAPHIWLFEKNGHTIALFGTMHGVPGGSRWLSPAAKRAFTDADLVLTEVGTTDVAQYNPRVSEMEGLAGILTRTDGLDSRDLAAPPGTPERAELDAAIELTGLRSATIGSQQAWALCIDLQRGESREAMLRMTPEAQEKRLAAVRPIGPIDSGPASPDARLERFRLSQGLPHRQLETFATRARAYAPMPEAEALTCIRNRAHAIVSGADWARFADRFRAAHDNWTRGDAEAARRMEVAESQKISRGYAARLFQARERQWLALIAERCDAAAIDCAIAVGFAHLGGADGLLRGLESLGYRRAGPEG